MLHHPLQRMTESLFWGQISFKTVPCHLYMYSYFHCDKIIFFIIGQQQWVTGKFLQAGQNSQWNHPIPLLERLTLVIFSGTENDRAMGFTLCRCLQQCGEIQTKSGLIWHLWKKLWKNSPCHLSGQLDPEIDFQFPIFKYAAFFQSGWDNEFACSCAADAVIILVFWC